MALESSNGSPIVEPGAKGEGRVKYLTKQGAIMFVDNNKHKQEDRLVRVCAMSKILPLLFIGGFAVSSFTGAAIAQDYDPLDQFRVEEGEPAPDSGNAIPDVDTLQFDSEEEQPADFGGMALDPNMTIEEQRAEIEQRMRDESYDAALNGLIPMNPQEIRNFLESYRDTRQASEERIGGVPTPEVRVETVSLDPGVVPPVIKLSPGHVTSLTMLDMTGQPWPVKDVTWGGNFEVISPGDGGHVIRINPMEAHAMGNMSIQLVGLKTPVTFSLQTQLEVVQYRFDARIPDYGPLAEAPIIETGMHSMRSAAKDKDLTRLLGGVTPDDMEFLSISGVDGRTTAYRHDGRIFLRTPLTLLSPAWDASVKSADGTTVYSLSDAPVLLLSDRGRMVRAMINKNDEAY